MMFQISGYSGTTGDAMNVHNNKYFTTFDSDNDNYGGNCAIFRKGTRINKFNHL